MGSSQFRFAATLFIGGLLVLGAGVWEVVDSRNGVVPAQMPRGNGTVAEGAPSVPAAPLRPTLERARVLTLAGVEPAGALPARLNSGGPSPHERRAELVAFNKWAERYVAAPPAGRASLVAQGVALAQARRETLKELIQSDPKQAIASAVPLALRAKLPSEIVAQLEERISGTGDLELLGITPAPGEAVAEPYSRRATVDGKTFRAYTYGRRDPQATKLNTSVSGVALDGALAVSESPLRVLEAGEVPAATTPVTAVCPVSGQKTALVSSSPLNLGKPTAVEVAGTVAILCHTEHIAEYEARLIKAEDAAGPYPVVFSLGDSGPGTSNITGRPPVSWSQGTKKVLFIRVDFPDKPGAPVAAGGGAQTIDDTFAVNQVNQPGGVRDFYQQGSYAKTTLAVAPVVSGDSPDVTPVYRLPKNASYYAVGDANDSFDGQMHTDARNLATAGGYNLNNYDRIGVVFSDLSGIPNSKITYGGRANVQGKNFWINGYFNFGTLIHEIGHTYGLAHSNLWQVSDGNPVSPNGTSLEYGDPYDPMGRNVVTVANHFNHWEKSLLQWIPDGAVKTVSTAGTYRVYRFDHSSANLANTLALKIVRNGTQDYWIGHRHGLSNPALLNGACILWGYNAVQQSNLLDFTPATDANDAPLAVGASFHDLAEGLTIHPLAAGGASPNEYLDVQISFDSRIQWSSTTYSFDEKLGGATLTLQRTGSTGGSVTVNYGTANGTATAPADYTATSGTVTWADGDAAPKTITVPLVADALDEGLRNFSVTLSGATGGAVIVNGATATVNIADAGSADPALNPDSINSAVEQVIVQPDGKLLIAGWFDTIYVDGTPYPRSGFARLNPDATLDAAFGNGAGANAVPVFAMARQPDGKILIGGTFATVHGVARACVARLNTDGSLDPGFNPGTGPNDEVHALALQPDGKILVGGKFTSVAGQARSGLARLNANGVLDTTFTGPAFLGFPNADVLSIALQPDNKPVVAGSFYFNPAPYKSGVARLNVNGTLDATFDPGYGAHIAGNSGFLQTVQRVAVQRDGKIVVGGYFTGFNNVTHYRLARLAANGSLDSSFAPAFDPTIPANTAPYPHVRTLLVQADGRMVIGGSFAQVNGSARSNFVRLNPDGTSDGTFAVGSGSTGPVNDATLQPDGKLVLGTDFGTIQGTGNRTLARLFTGLPGLPGTVQFSTPNYSGTEGSALTVTATRTGGSYGAISMNYATQAGSAAATRYTPVNGTLSWASGDAASKTFSVPILNDNLAQPDQTFSLNLGIPIGGIIPGAPGTAGVTIRTPAGNVGATSATLHGEVNPNGSATTVYFQYGTSASYGQTTPAIDIGSGSSPVSFSAQLIGLLPNTTYHYRLVTGKAGGTVYSVDQTFTTLAAAADYAEAGTWVVQRTVRTLPLQVNGTVDIGTFTFETGTGTLEITVNAASSGYSVSKQYFIPMRFNQPPINTWLKVLPSVDTGPHSNNDFDLDISVNTTTAALRLRTTSTDGTHAGTARIAIKSTGLETVVNSTTTAIVTAPTQSFSGNAINQTVGKVGLGTSASPDGLLDVNGGDTRGLRLRARSVPGAPATGTWSKGTMILDSTGILYVCTTAGTPGVWKKVGN